MFSVWLKLLTILCLCCRALTDAGVVWKHVGEAVTIKCIVPSNGINLSVRKGLDEEIQIFFFDKDKRKLVIFQPLQARLQSDNNFPELSIRIKNLTLNDTGPYWCKYTYLDINYNPKTSKAPGSVLLVVTENRNVATNAVSKCEEPQNEIVLLSVLICAAVIVVILVCILLILKIKPQRTTVKPRQVPTNDVYEDMRGTVRR
ncbi:uncharacterized protein KZ484_004465 [Pholidichthys leucotaenia]